MKKSNTAARIFDRIVDSMAFTAGILAVIVMTLICYLVIMRYLFGKPPAWILEVCEYLLIYITFMSATWLLRRDGHVRVDLFISWISPAKQKTMRIITSIGGALACLALSWCGLLVTLDYYTRDILSIQTISVPKWVLYVIIPVGSLLLAVEFFRQAFNDFIHAREHRLHSEENNTATEQGAQ